MESYKIGIVPLILGIMNVFNIMVFSRMRCRGIDGPPANRRQAGYVPRTGFPPPPASGGAAY